MRQLCTPYRVPGLPLRKLATARNGAYSQTGVTTNSKCSVHSILGFLQSLLDLGSASSTVQVYAADISSFHQPVDGQVVAKHPLVSQFIRGAGRLRPGRALRAPSWDLATVLHSLTLALYEPLEADLKFLTQKSVSSGDLF